MARTKLGQQMHRKRQISLLHGLQILGAKSVVDAVLHAQAPVESKQAWQPCRVRGIDAEARAQKLPGSDDGRIGLPGGGRLGRHIGAEGLPAEILVAIIIIGGERLPGRADDARRHGDAIAATVEGQKRKIVLERPEYGVPGLRSQMRVRVLKGAARRRRKFVSLDKGQPAAADIGAQPCLRRALPGVLDRPPVPVNHQSGDGKQR